MGKKEERVVKWERQYVSLQLGMVGDPGLTVTTEVLLAAVETDQLCQRAWGRLVRKALCLKR